MTDSVTPPGLRVLVVEDHEPSAASIEQFLRLSGHEVRVASNGPTAVASVRANRPDVVLLDIGLPGTMDGYEVARAIGDEPAEKRPLLVAVTGHGALEDRRLSELVGIDLHLVKPVDAFKLQGLLERFQRVVAG